MNGEPHMHDVVALLEDIQAKHFESGQPLLLRRGQMGTVVMIYKNSACDVEFADRDGRTYALLPVEAGKLMVLRDSPEHATA
jgi:hypothetical protein